MFTCPHTNHWLKIAHAVSRATNLKSHYKNTRGLACRYFEVPYDKINEVRNVPTYQTVSAVAHYLLLKQLIEQEDVTQFKVPPTYALVLDPNQLPHDGNTVVVQATADPSVVPLHEHPDRKQKRQYYCF